MKFKTYAIIADAVELAVEGSVAGATGRWFKHRDGEAPALLADREFLDHVESTIRDNVMDQLCRVIDMDDQDEVTVNSD